MDFDLIRSQWESFEASAARWGEARYESLHPVAPSKSASPIVSYSRDLIRLALLPPDLRSEVLDWIVNIVKQAVKRGDLPARSAQRRQSRGRKPI